MACEKVLLAFTYVHLCSRGPQVLKNDLQPNVCSRLSSCSSGALISCRDEKGVSWQHLHGCRHFNALVT